MDGDVPKSVTSNSSGAYSFTVAVGWSGIVTPSKSGMIFEPVNRSYSNLQANQTDQNYKSIVMVTNNADSGTGSLRQVISNATAGSTIRFDPSLAGQTITLASTISVTKNLTIDGSTIDPRVEISGNNAVRIFLLGSSSSNVVLQSLILKDGSAPGTGNNGGAMYLGGGTISINDVDFIGNSADLGGAISGALYNLNFMISNCTFISNSARSSGGAIYMQYSPVSIRNSILTDNSAAVNGGALYLSQSDLQAENNTFVSNRAVNGGAIYFQFTNSSILRGNLFSNNIASSKGGAAHVEYVYSTNFVTIENNTFYSNQAENGGALSLKYKSFIQNNTFYDNQATSVTGVGGTSILFLTPFNVTLNNNILAHGSGGKDCSISGTGTQSLTSTNNLMDDGTSPCIDLPGSIGYDVFLDAPADHGGPTWTMSLPPDSAALEAGDDASCTARPITAAWLARREVIVT